MENWAPIRGFSGYSVSDLGRVRNEDTKRVLSISMNQYGTAYVGIMRDGIRCQRSLALLVAKAFLPEPEEFFDTPINLDGDRFNCAVDNLMWRPRWYARKYHWQFRHRYPSEALRAPLRAIETGVVYRSPFDAAKAYGLLEVDVRQSANFGTHTPLTFTHFEWGG